MTKVTDLMVNEGPSVFYNETFRTLLEEHISVIKQDKLTERMPIDPNLLYRHEYDLYGLLNTLKYPREYHWIVLRLNDLHNNLDFTRNIKTILIPNLSQVENLIKVFRTKEDYI